MKKIYNITILWATSGFGKWLHEYIQKEFWDLVDITITGSKSNNIAAVKDADIVIYSVPISMTEAVIKETLPHIKSGAVVADVTSIKKFPSEAMNGRDDLIVIPTHPMFWPYISSIAGQVFVLTPSENVKNTKEYIFLQSYLRSQKAKVREETAKNHDRMMAVVQGLTHLNMFVVGETMKRLGFDIGASMDFISPIYKLMVSSVGRYLGQNPRLYADIQMYNDEVIPVHEAFLDTAKNFHSSVAEKNTIKFCDDIVAARDFLWEKNCEEGQEYTDKIIYLLWKQVDIIKKRMWENIELKNIYSQEVVSWKLLDFAGNAISLDDNKKYSLNHWEVF